jgi:uncharacterized protein YhdP
MIKLSLFFTLLRHKIPRVWLKKVSIGLTKLICRETNVLAAIIKALGCFVLVTTLLTVLLISVLHYCLADLTAIEPYIARKITQTLHQPVEIKGITAQWHWNKASLNVAQLKIGSPTSPQILAKQVYMSIPLYPLIWGKFTTKALDINELNITIKQTGRINQPQWFAAGFDLNQPSDGSSLRWALTQPSITVDKLILNIHDTAKHWVPESNTQLSLQRVLLSNTVLQALSESNIINNINYINNNGNKNNHTNINNVSNTNYISLTNNSSNFTFNTKKSKTPKRLNSNFEHVFQAEFTPNVQDVRLGSNAKLFAKFNHASFADIHDTRLWQGEANILLPAVNVKPTAHWLLNQWSNTQATSNKPAVLWQKWLNNSTVLRQSTLSLDTRIQFSPKHITVFNTAKINQLPDTLGKTIPFTLQWQWNKATQYKQATHRVIAKIPTLTLAPWLNQVKTMPLSTSLITALATAQPQAVLKNIIIDSTVDTKKITGLNFSTLINNATINAFNWQSNSNSNLNSKSNKNSLTIPSVQGVSGQLNIHYSHHNTPQTTIGIKLNSQNPMVVLPKLLAEPTIVLQAIKGDIELTINQKAINVALNNIQFNNNDAEGILNGSYYYDLNTSKINTTINTAINTVKNTQINSLGILNLQGRFARVNIANIYRYLPLTLSESARKWLKHTLVNGQMNQVNWSIKGDVSRFPFVSNSNPIHAFKINSSDNTKNIPHIKNNAEYFKLQGILTDGTLNFNPVVTAPQLTWPLIQSVTGNIMLQGNSMALSDMKGNINTVNIHKLINIDSLINTDNLIKTSRPNTSTDIATPTTELLKATPEPELMIQVPHLTINNLSEPIIIANIKTQATTQNILDLIRNTPLSTHLSEPFNTLKTQGISEIDAHLNLDITKPEAFTTQGTAMLKEATLSLSKDLPAIEQINASINFKETGFTVEAARANWLGGDVTLTGGFDIHNTQKTVHLTGQAHLEKIKQYSTNPMAQALLKRAEGQLEYDLALNTNEQGVSWIVKADLTNTKLKWPGFLDKAVGTPLPFSLARVPIQRNKSLNNIPSVINHDKWEVSLGETVLGPFQGVVERQLHNNTWAIERGAVALGDDAVLNTPDTGLGVHIVGKSVNLDHIQTELTALPWKTLPIDDVPQPSMTPLKPPAWMPSTIAVQVDDLTFGHRLYRNIISGASRNGVYGENWNGNLVAQGINGYFSWKDPHLSKDLGKGQLQLKLTELTIPPSELEDSKQSLLNILPNQVPSVELNIDKLTLGTHFLGNISLQARNTTRPIIAKKVGVVNIVDINDTDPLLTDERGWDIQSLTIQHPHFDMQAKGAWQHNTQYPQGQVHLNFKLKTDSLGNVLNDFKYDPIVAAAAGEVTGDIAWQGTPFGIDIANLSGNITGQFKEGHFLKADPGVGRLVGLFSLQNLPRRLSLNFKDTFGEGFSFDKVNMTASINKGQLTMDSFLMRSSLAKITAVGKVSLTNEKQALRFTIKPEINAGSASLLYMAINPVIGLSTLAAQWLFREPLTDSLTTFYDITGSWIAPEVNSVKRKTALPYTENGILN